MRPRSSHPSGPKKWGKSIKTSIDILELAGRYTTLRKCAQHEYAGPCPQCAGCDRFHVHTDGWWFCRQCHARRGDVIELVRFVEGCDFMTACARLGAPTTWPARSAQPSQASRVPKPWRSDAWQDAAWTLLTQAQARLEHDAGAPGRAYLQQRGITPETWRAWQLGYGCDRTGRWGIVLPWLLPDGRITAVKYRRLTATKQDGRFAQKRGGEQLLFGTQLIDASARTLVLVEGELNALSIWQAGRDLGLAVVSFGGQNAQAAIRKAGYLARSFERALVWCDETERARAVMQAVGTHAQGIQSPKTTAAPHGLDANDLLQCGLLRALLERKLGHDDVDPAALIAHNRALIRQFLAGTVPGTLLPASLLTFDEDTPVRELQAIRVQLAQAIEGS